MNRIIAGVGLVIFATALVAQDVELTPEQIAAKCAAGGGCVTLTIAELIRVAHEEGQAGYRQGLRACRNAT